MAISFGGLASGLDTTAIIDALMGVERQPIVRLEADKEFFGNRHSAFTEFNSRLTTFLTSVEALNSGSAVQPKTAGLSNEDFFGATASATAANGSYQLKAFSLAQVEKLVSDAGQFADKDTTTYKTGTLNLTVDGDLTSITIDDSNNTLAGIAQAINDADAGVSASIINDGAATNPYRLVLTGDSVPDTIPGYAPDTSISLDTSELTAGSGADFTPVLSISQQAQQAHIQIDSIDIYGATNTFTEAISGVTLTIDDADAGATTTNLAVNLDEAALKSKLQEFVSGYNNVMSFISEQSSFNEDKVVGLLSGDSTLSMVKRRMQSLLTTRVDGNESISTFSELGLETQRDGSLTLDDATLTDAIKNNLDDVVQLLAGGGSGASEVEGISSRFQEYLEDITSKTSGFLNARQKSYDNNIRRMDNDIQRLEMRLAKREEALNKQFSALENLMSLMNSQSNFLSQQTELMKNLWSRN